MLRTKVSKVMWVGRATVLLVGLAVILAAVLGVATAALAGTGVGAAFNLGRLNTVNQISRLVGKTDAPMRTPWRWRTAAGPAGPRRG